MNKQYMSRKAGEGRLLSIEAHVDGLIRRLKDNIKKSKERLIKATRKNANNTRNYNKSKKKMGTRILQATNKRNITQEELDIPKKGKI